MDREESFDKQVGTSLNVVFLLNEKYRADESMKHIKTALLNANSCCETVFKKFFNQQFNMQRIGIANVIALHLHGMVQLALKTPQTLTAAWYRPFDECLQMAI